MRSFFAFIIFTGLLIFVLTLPASAQQISDPYEILNRYFEAAGGINRLSAEQTSYSEGTLTVGGMEGTIKVWTQRPDRSRAEINLGPLKMTQGDNGRHAWVMDQNGQVQLITNPDEATIKRRQVRKLIEEYAYLEKGSDIFTVSFEGVESVDGNECYIVKIANKINNDSHTYYINTGTFNREKAVFIEDVESRDAIYSDYREIDGLMIPFRTQEIPHQTGQTHEIIITDYISNPGIDSVLFEPPEAGAKDYQFTNGNCAENIPFKFIGNHLYIPVTVQGKERIWVLDTGAGMTVLNQAFADELGIIPEGALKGRDAGGIATASIATLPPYSLKGIQFQSQTAAVIDMSELILRLGVDVVGILGYDFLSRFVTKIDYANELVSFYDPEKFNYAGDGHLLGMHISNNLFEVQATLDGIHSGNWLFDIGAGSTGLDGRYALREGYAKKDGILRLGHGAVNEYQKKKVLCDSLQFAGFTILKPEIEFSYGGTDTNFTADQIGVLGNSVFQNFVLYCDYAHERLFVEKGGNFDLPRPRDNSGLDMTWNQNHEVSVSYVSPGTPAEKAGFVKGDIIQSINAIKTDLLGGLNAVRELLRAEPGTAYEFAIDRAGEKKKLKLTLAELY